MISARRRGFQPLSCHHDLCEEKRGRHTPRSDQIAESYLLREGRNSETTSRRRRLFLRRRTLTDELHRQNGRDVEDASRRNQNQRDLTQGACPLRGDVRVQSEPCLPQVAVISGESGHSVIVLIK